MIDKIELGSRTAKGGFDNELDIVRKFNNWKKDKTAQKWLEIMGYRLDKLDSVTAIQVPTKISQKDIEKYNVTIDEYNEFVRFKKADAQVKLIIKIGNIIRIENLSLKKANSNADYNQIDKRTVDSYQEMWKFDDEIAFWLKLFTGEILPKEAKGFIKKIKPRVNRRLFLDEIPEEIQNKIVNFFERNKILVISDLIKGRGGLSANWMLVTMNNVNKESTSWILKDINTTLNFYGDGSVFITPRGSLRIGRITMQRKGGTPDPTKIQFKFKPCELFEIV